MRRAVRSLTAGELESPELRRLLWFAAEVDDAALARILEVELPRLQVLGVREGDRVVAFVAYDAGVDPTTIEYVAVDDVARGRGHGAALVEAVRARSAGREVRALTDDDAVDFYRRLGFSVADADPDPRWPDRRRYDCRLG